MAGVNIGDKCAFRHHCWIWIERLLRVVDTKLIARYAIRETMGIVVMGVALFWSAGQIDWWPAWAAIVVMSAWITATAIVIFHFNPDLLAKRLGPRKGAKPWDIAIMSILGLTQLARYIVAGLDQRYGWTGSFPLAAQIAKSQYAQINPFTRSGI
jgi:hypothetical protein